MRKLAGLNGAGHYFGNDGEFKRDAMFKDEIERVLRLLSLGEKAVNFKRREFLTFYFG